MIMTSKLDLQMRVLRILETSEPLNLHEIASALIATGTHSTATQLDNAIEGLRSKGYQIHEYDDADSTRYWLETGGGAA